MEIAKVAVSGVRAQTVQAEPIPVGIVGATVKLEFTDPLWDGLDKHILFSGATDRPVVFAEDSVELPAAVVAVPNILVKMGVWGVSPDGKIAIPTLWAELGTVKPATDKDMGADPGLPIWAQILNMIGDLRKLNTADKSNLVAAVNEAMRNTGGGAGGYYMPVVTQPTANTMQISFTPSAATMPAVEPVTINLPGADSSQNANGLSEELNTALVNYFTHVMPNFDDANGMSYVNAILTALGAETRGESGGEETPDEPVIPDEPEVTLTSISAVYSGGDVTVGTAVADLTGIVVTAHYSDGSTETVTDYTLSGTIAEGSNTVTVSYGGKTTTFAVTGVAEESGGDDTGGAVAVAMTDTAYLGFPVSAYSEDGTNESEATTTLDKSAMRQYSEMYFTEDTEVTITFNATGTILTRKAIACCVPAAATIFNKAYYCVELGSFNDIINAGGVKYTVKAGHKLYLIQTSSPAQGTFSVTRDGAEGDGVMATYAMSGEDVAVTTDLSFDSTAHTWYADSGTTTVGTAPTGDNAFMALSTEVFAQDTEVVVEMYISNTAVGDIFWAASYNGTDYHFAEQINNSAVTVSERPRFVYTVKAGYQLVVVSKLHYAYEIKVVK